MLTEASAFESLSLRWIKKFAPIVGAFSFVPIEALIMFYVYILKSVKADKYYVGQTRDVAERLRRHNAGMEKFTSVYAPWKLVGVIIKSTRSEAMILERKLKNLSKTRLENFVNNYCKSGGADEA